jgi:hypothetical protein
MPYTDEEEDVAQEVDDMPASLKEGMEDDEIEIPGEDVSQAEAMSNEDFIDPAKGVVFEITKVLIDTYTPKDRTEWMKRSLKLYVAVDKSGVDGKGKYARKMFFPRILVQVNREDYDFTKDWYKPKSGGAWGEYNELLTALGFPNNPAPKNDAAFRKSLVGRKFMADISKDKREVYDQEKKKYTKVDGEFENHLRSLRPVKAVAATESAEAAAS